MRTFRILSAVLIALLAFAIPTTEPAPLSKKVEFIETNPIYSLHLYTKHAIDAISSPDLLEVAAGYRGFFVWIADEVPRFVMVKLDPATKRLSYPVHPAPAGMVALEVRNFEDDERLAGFHANLKYSPPGKLYLLLPDATLPGFVKARLRPLVNELIVQKLKVHPSGGSVHISVDAILFLDQLRPRGFHLNLTASEIKPSVQ